MNSSDFTVLIESVITGYEAFPENLPMLIFSAIRIIDQW
jgi:hypothetical protein